MSAVILSIGDELVLGQTVDTNSAYLSAELASLGISTLYHQTVGDDVQGIANAIEQATKVAETVIVSGGVGPTEDDLTRQALGKVLGQPLQLHQESLRRIERLFRRRSRPMPPRNQIQAMHPRGSEMIDNHHGTAPGIKTEFHGTVIFVVPGVPHEMTAMFVRSIAPELSRQEAGGRVILATTIHTLGLGESDVAQKLGVLMDRQRNPKVGTTVADGIVSVRIRSEFSDKVKADEAMWSTVEQVEHSLGPIVYGHDDETIQEVLVGLLKDQGTSVATAESCTGGLLAKMITDVAGASEVYRGGWVTYLDEMKSNLLAVPKSLLRDHGAVSEPVAKAMAEGALQNSGADLCVAITGIAGPEGGSEEKPVGTVWIALATYEGIDAAPFHFPGGRAAIRDRAAKSAAQLTRFHLLGEDPQQMSWYGRGGFQR